MHRQRTVVLAAALSFSLAMGGLVGSTTALASGYGGGYTDDEGPDGGDMIADVAAVRPLTFLAGALGGALWVISLPFTIPGGNAGEAADTLFVGPMRYTFYRPLGHLKEEDSPYYAD